MKIVLKALIFLLIFGSSHFFVQAQGPEDIKKIEAISKYVSGNSQRVDQLLTRFGYQPPDYLKSQFPKYPALRKIRMAYQAAENGTTKKGGKILIEKFYENLANKYQAIRSEKALKGVQTTNAASNLKFKHPESYKNSSLPSSIKNQIFSISKYVESGGLGGARGVLKHRFQLTNDEVFDILNKSLSNQDALERGINIAKEPPPKKERIKRIASEINRKYQGARSDPSIQQIVGKNENIDFKQRRKSYKKTSTNPNTKVIQRIATKNNATRYGGIIENSFNDKGSKAFSKMKIHPRGFGGIVFGNELEDNTDLGELEFIRALPIESDSLYIEAAVDLEFVFRDGTNILISSIYAEDIYAVHHILYHDEYPFIEGEGIGIFGIENNLFTLTGISHPVVADLKLFPIFRYCDIFFDTLFRQEFDNDIINDKFDEFKNGMPSARDLGWYKITDVPLRIEYNYGELFLRRNDTIQNKEPYAFITLMSPKTQGEITYFYDNVPFLVDINYEFNRLNEFARTFTLLRWAKRKGVQLMEIPIVETSEEYLQGASDLNEQINSIQNELDRNSEEISITIEFLKTSTKLENYFISSNSKSKLISMIEKSKIILENSWDELLQYGSINSDSNLCGSSYSFVKLDTYFNSNFMEYFNLSMRKTKLEEDLEDIESDILEYDDDNDKEIKKEIMQKLTGTNTSMLSVLEGHENLNLEQEFIVLKKIENPNYELDNISGLDKRFETLKQHIISLGCD